MCLMAKLNVQVLFVRRTVALEVPLLPTIKARQECGIGFTTTTTGEPASPSTPKLTVWVDCSLSVGTFSHLGYGSSDRNLLFTAKETYNYISKLGTIKELSGLTQDRLVLRRFGMLCASGLVCKGLESGGDHSGVSESSRGGCQLSYEL